MTKRTPSRADAARASFAGCGLGASPEASADARQRVRLSSVRSGSHAYRGPTGEAWSACAIASRLERATTSLWVCRTSPPTETLDPAEAPSSTTSIALSGTNTIDRQHDRPEAVSEAGVTIECSTTGVLLRRRVGRSLANAFGVDETRAWANADGRDGGRGPIPRWTRWNERQDEVNRPMGDELEIGDQPEMGDELEMKGPGGIQQWP